MQPLHKELYTLHPTTFFLPSFLKAISDNTEESFRSMMSEPSPGVFTFEMLQPRFCELLLAEVYCFIFLGHFHDIFNLPLSIGFTAFYVVV